jgi:2-oxoglutarate ferredoxin oxidoreductase subunit gamma
MALHEILMAGFGGQGMLLSGKLLAYAAMTKGKEVSWLPSYGPEMRGGTANVTVCISDKPVGSPYISTPRTLLVMNQPSLERFGPKVKPGGLIIVNSSLVPIQAERDDCTVMVMLGTLVGFSKIMDRDTIIKMIKKEFKAKAKFIPANVAAFEAGLKAGNKARGGKK